jgi:hypothetical protein
MEEKVLISLVSVGVGWALGRGTDVVKDFYQSWKLKKSLLEELADIHEQLLRVQLSYARQLQIYANQGLDAGFPIPIPNLFFKEFYKDVFARLNREQRLSYQLIHGLIDTLNNENSKFVDLTKKLVEEFRHEGVEGKFAVDIQIWGDRLQALYLMTAECIWHIARHLDSPRRPTMDLMGPMHEKFAQHEAKTRKEMEQIIEAAKTIPRKDFETVYDEKFFRR